MYLLSIGFIIYLYIYLNIYKFYYKILYYTSNSLNEFCADLGIHPSSYKKCISNDSPFLNFFIISKILKTKAVLANLPYYEVRELIAKHRKENLGKLHLSYGKIIEVFDKEINETMTFTSINKASYMASCFTCLALP